MSTTEGTVLVCGTGQAGTLINVSGDTFTVLLRNGEIWTGHSSQCRVPQSPDDLASCPLEVEKTVPLRKKPKRNDEYDR